MYRSALENGQILAKFGLDQDYAEAMPDHLRDCRQKIGPDMGSDLIRDDFRKGTPPTLF